MVTCKIEKINLNKKILAVCCTDNIYIGLENEFLNYTTQKLLCVHEKCIRSISFNDSFIGCCSYDSTVNVFDREERYKEKIEGPDTEIKGIAFYENFLAITTRGKTTWILEDFEISEILEDHIQDVKGCCFQDRRLYTWSYDGTVKVYDLFEIDHTWKLSQSIDIGDIIWSVVFFNGYLCATLQNGCLAIFELKAGTWVSYKTITASITPIYCATITNDAICIVCNRNSLLLLDGEFKKIGEVENLNDGCDIFSCSFFKCENSIILGSEDGTLTKVIFN
ncbi:hypothetical protein GINT2_001392 [Glugoides intestinalis]